PDFSLEPRRRRRWPAALAAALILVGGAAWLAPQLLAPEREMARDEPALLVPLAPQQPGAGTETASQALPRAIGQGTGSARPVPSRRPGPPPAWPELAGAAPPPGAVASAPQAAALASGPHPPSSSPPAPGSTSPPPSGAALIAIPTPSPAPSPAP